MAEKKLPVKKAPVKKAAAPKRTPVKAKSLGAVKKAPAKTGTQLKMDLKGQANPNRGLVKQGNRLPAKTPPKALPTKASGQVATQRGLVKSSTKLPGKINTSLMKDAPGKLSAGKVASKGLGILGKITKVAAMVDVASNMPTTRIKSSDEKKRDTLSKYQSRYMKEKGMSASKAMEAAKKEYTKTEETIAKNKTLPGRTIARGALTGLYAGVKSAKEAQKVEANRKKGADNKAKVQAPKTPTKSTGPTVSQLWTEKTGLAWSEAKKRGLSDGSLNSNLALMKKLKSGEVSKSSLESKTPTTASTTTSTTEEIPQGLGRVSVESRLSEMEPKPKLAQIRTEYSAPKKPQTKKEIRQENRRMRKMKKGGTFKSVTKKRK